MRQIYLLSLAGLLLLTAACSKKEEERPCNTVLAGSSLRFRVLDSAGKDYLHGNGARPDITQPCRASALAPVFIPYEVPGTADTGILITFTDMRTPDYGEGGECFRIFFTWNGTDTDTLDWHYKVDESGACTQQIVDYISFNGKQVESKSDGRYTYYRLMK